MANTSGLNNLKQQFKENKQLRTITFAVGGILIVIVGYIAYNQFVFGPKNDKSKEAYYVGLNFAAKDSTDAAIDELESVVKKYDGTVGGEIAQFTLARQYMAKGDFKKALGLLEGVNLKDTYGASRVIGLQGDCKSELGSYSEAIDLYQEAASTNENEQTSPEYLFKAGLVAEKTNDFAKAAELYIRIRDNYSAYSQQKVIDKYIARAENKKIK